uniref:Putative glutamic acid rich protein n=1 Tax=Trypanosoma cruzi TaxID=5693 RepID=Q50HP9_TRYCR|nr:putative glutamic acid rich protein [Trypanosoma cruzi]
MLRRRITVGFVPQTTFTSGVVAATWSHATYSTDAIGTFKPLPTSFRRIGASCRYAAGSHTGLYVGSRAQSTSTPSLCTLTTRPLPASPHQCSIEKVLLPSVQASGSGIRTDTLRGMVQLLLDPDATDVEDVFMLDFVVMVPKRQMAALHGRKEWLDVVLSSERYQACKDESVLRLAGITTVGRWDENRERVPISAYSRGILEEAYAAMARQPVESQKNQVITWLTKTIQKAVIEEFAANKSNRQFLAPLITGMQALPETADAASNAANAAAMKEGDETYPQGEADVPRKKRAEDAAAEDGNGGNNTAKPNKPARVRGRKHAKHPEPVEEVTEHAGDGAAKSAASATSTTEDVKKNDKPHSVSPAAATDDDEDAEIARLLQETEQEFAPAPYIRGSIHSKGASEGSAAASTSPPQISTAATTSVATARAEAEDVKPSKLKKKKSADAANKLAEPEHHNQQQEENATAVTDAGKTLPDSKQNKSLARLAELMLIQFNSADGYLHLPDIKDDEKKGFVIALDGDSAQVDPFALYSTFGAAKLAGGESPAITALYQVWSAYSAYTEAHEAAEDDATAKFFKEKGVEALVHGAVLLRAISREQAVTLEPQDIPAYGFPLLSSDRRPHRTRRSKVATDMTAEKVADAVKAYTAFFSTKGKKFTPIRPTIDYNSGCSVAALMGTTLHLYETSLKETVREEDIRCRFGEAMLGVLHVVEKKVMTRINVVHYHILATSISGGSGGSNSMESMTTSIVSIDITGSFTTAEKTRLLQLAEPLGMAGAIADCTCVSDIVDSIEALGVSVVHDILTNRDDLEALLTPTLVQLLPEAEEEEEEEEEEAEKQPSTRRTSAAASTPAKDASSKSGSHSSHAAAGVKAAATAAEDDDDDEEEEEEEADGVDAVGEEAAEEEENEEEEEEEEEVKPARGGKQKSAAAKHKTDTVNEDEENEEVEEEEEEEEEDEEQKAGNGEEEDDEEQEEEEEAPREPPTISGNSRRHSSPAPVKGRSARGRAHPAEDAKKMREKDEEYDGEGDGDEPPRQHVQHVQQRAPPLRKTSHAGKRAPPPPPPAASGDDNDDDDDASDADDNKEEEVHAQPQSQQHTAVSKKGHATKKSPPPPPSTAVTDNDEDEEEEEVVRRPTKKGVSSKRAPPPPVAAQNDDSKEEEEEVVVAPRVRNRGRRMGRALPQSSSDSNDEDRWFQRARR